MESIALLELLIRSSPGNVGTAGGLRSNATDDEIVRTINFLLMMIILVLLPFWAVTGAVRYACASLAASLAVVEQEPHAVGRTRYRTYDAAPSTPVVSAPSREVFDEERPLLVEPMVTSSLRRTFRHLRDQGDAFSMLRGAHVALFIELVSHGVSCLLLVRDVVQWWAYPLVVSAVKILLYRVTFVWVHHVVTKYRISPVRRFFSGPLAWRIAPLVILSTVINQACSSLVVAGLVSRSYSPLRMMNLPVLLLIGMLLSLWLNVPILVVMVRVAACSLPERDEAIVLSDKSSFRSRLTSEKRPFGYVEAWKTFSADGRRRVTRIYAKTSLFLVVSYFLLATVTYISVMVHQRRYRD